jgi:hypothetical protein
MNANPYAAPQTIHARFHMHELPVAESRGNEDERRDFREFSTEQLTQFQLKSRAIDKAQFVWLLAVVVAIIAGICWLSFNRTNPKLSDFQYYPWYIGFGVVVLRFCAGIDRRRWMRPLIVGMDAALVAVCGICLLNPKFYSFLHNCSLSGWHAGIVIVLIALVYLASKSGIAAFHAPELFSKHRYSHARLCQELDYRKEYGIE